MPGITPDPSNAAVFVAATNLTYLFALALSAVPLLTSWKLKKTGAAQG